MSGEQVLLGMSGGVDSAAAAALLRQAGYVPVGCTLRLFDSDDPASASRQEEDARAVCAHLGIEFVPFRATEAFRRRVLDDFVASYAAGRTPNPWRPVQPVRQIPRPSGAGGPAGHPLYRHRPLRTDGL